MAEPKIIVAENVGEELGKLIKTEADSFFNSSQDSDLVIGLSGIFRGYLSLTPWINCKKLKKEDGVYAPNVQVKCLEGKNELVVRICTPQKTFAYHIK